MHGFIINKGWSGKNMVKKREQEKIELQQKVYEFLIEYITKNGFPPSLREIRDGMELKSTSSAYECLCMLQERGKIEVKYDTARAIKLVGYKFVKEENM